MHKILEKIFTNPLESLSIFTEDEINSLKFYQKEEGSDKWYLKSFSRGEEEKLVSSEKNNAPEEIVRQIYLYRLINKYKYPQHLIEVEVSVHFGRERKRADVIIYKEDNTTPYIVAEIKAPHEKNAIKQLKSYLNAEGAEIGVVINGLTEEILHRPYPKDFLTLPDLPEYKESPEDVFSRKFTYKELTHPKQLKQVIQNLEDLVLANSGYDSFDEIFKIIYAKIWDEVLGQEDANYVLNFRSRKDADLTKIEINKLLDKAKIIWPGIFDDSDTIKLRASHLNAIVANLQEYSLMGSDLQVIDDAFEYLIPDVAKGKKGQYFTPRHVIDMCVQMLRPTDEEKVIDTACGSGGFLIHAMNWVEETYKITTPSALKRYASKHLWGIDFDERSSKISKAMMLIAGDGKSHIYKENSLDSSAWGDRIKMDLNEGRLLEKYFEKESKIKNEDLKSFTFDVLLANPPFAGNVEEEHILKQFPGVVKEKAKKISRHLLFIERNLNFVKDGGRLALVLPQGTFNNTSEKYIREFVADKARILAVVGLEGNTFKPHTGTKTSVIFLQKWDNEKCPKPKSGDYSIFFATSEKSGKDNSGEYIRDAKGTVIHDLNDVVENFRDFAKTEKFSF